MKVLVTGATGFIGGELVRRLVNDKTYEVVAAVRQKSENLENIVKCVQVSDLSENTDWTQAVSGVDIVVHTAARVHIMDEHSDSDSLAEFRKINVQGTLNLAKQAAAASVKRFIFISSIKANGEETFDEPFTADSLPAPTTTYGISKYEAEKEIIAISEKTGMEFVIIRPPLVYGAGAKGNFVTLIKLTKLGIPLPFSSLHNKRSLVGIDNLVDFIKICLAHEKAKNQVFLVSDGENISTAALIRAIGKAIGKPVILLPFPASLIKILLKLLGKEEIAQRICGSLQVDIAKNKQLTGWVPPASLHENLAKIRNIYG